MVNDATVLVIDGQLLDSWQAEKPEDIDKLLNITLVLQAHWIADSCEYEANIAFEDLEDATCSADGEIQVKDIQGNNTRIHCYQLLPILEPKQVYDHGTTPAANA